MKPSLARIVIYVLTDEDKKELLDIIIKEQDREEDSKIQNEVAAWITWCESNDETALVNLMCMDKNGAAIFIEGIQQGTLPGQWHEPERV